MNPLAEEWIDLLARRATCRVPLKINGSNGRAYAVQDQLGEGSNAVVHECEDEIDGTVHAVKFLIRADAHEGLPRFMLETKLIETLSASGHDHLVHFIASGTAPGQVYDRRRKQYVNADIPFFIMEKAASSLRDYVGGLKDSIAPEIYIAQFRGLVSALETLHEHAIHRDIKPENILVVGERWLISDFGICSMIAKEDGKDLTQVWRVPGPRFWMSPEANNKSVGLADEIGAASDIFQLAAVFWWVVNRRHPSGILAREDWVGSEKLFEPIYKALQHSLTRRYASAKDFGAAVSRAIVD